jgi:hypothetical protein
MKLSDLKKKLLAKGLVFSLMGDLVSGIFFGVGYFVVDHFNDWIDTQSPAGVSAQTTSKSSKPSVSHPPAHDLQQTTDRDRSSLFSID